MRDVAGTVSWYRANESFPGAVGFDPDGMCMKICRTARDIGPGAASALASQQMTPKEFRVHQIRKIRRGHVLYFDDPNDSNPFGHIVTVVARVRDADPDSLNSILVRTNSVVSNQIVVVHADFFGLHWGDSFQYAGEWINGVPLSFPDEQAKARPEPRFVLPEKGRDRLRAVLDVYEGMVEEQRSEGNERVARALTRDMKEIRETINKKAA